MKQKNVYICQNCGAVSPKWVGKCPSCQQWNTYVEEIVSAGPKNGLSPNALSEAKPVRISEIETNTAERIDTNNTEFNRVLGGGIVPGSVILIGGEPGIGKSTLSIQIALNIPQQTLYVSGEESASQIKLRADRIKKTSDNCLILCEVTVENIIPAIRQTNPSLVIIDSIQTLRTQNAESAPGTVTQIRECADMLIRFAKENNVPIILIGHINKDGNIAGPKILEHMVDTVLQFEGDSSHVYRVLRGIKNRFGTTSEVGIFEMLSDGLRQVSNPGELLIHHHDNDTPGVTVTAAVEGLRPFLIEVQSLVSTAAYGVPQRSTTGFDAKRLNMLLAVLERRCGFRLNTKDVFLNIAGGIKINDPAMDLSVITAVLSSDLDIAIPHDVCFAGEVGLTGEIRPVSRVEQRIAEAEKIGFKKIIISSAHNKNIENIRHTIDITTVSKIEEVFRLLFVRKNTAHA
ncbi:MAG: DNA repair protein RadA [Bacteroidales bacterium]|nr:DNA repair protein RadA [Bacteroidales bacterium]